MSDPDSGSSLPARVAPDVAVRWAPAAAVAAAVLVASVVDPGSKGGLPNGPLHVVAYASLGGAIAHATRGDGPWRRAALVVVGATGYGLAMELLQVPIPYREFDGGDVLANWVGATLSLAWLAVEAYAAYGRE